MEKIRAAMLIAPMGHDVARISEQFVKWMEKSGVFEVKRAGDFPGSTVSIHDFLTDKENVAWTEVFLLMCPDESFDAETMDILEQAVAGGKGILCYHGVHPCYRDWPAMEAMIGLLWRETASHGDYDYFTVQPTLPEHPIMEGITPFETKEELYCGLSNVQNVSLTVLATAHSPKERISRHGQPGTGNEEPVLTLGSYGKGITVNFLLGHVWTHYTGHGLLENTLLSLRPPQFKTLLLRSCEWAARGEIVLTKGEHDENN